MADSSQTTSLAPLRQIVEDVESGKSSTTLALFLIEKHIEHARTGRGITRRDQIAALVLPAVMLATDAAQRAGYLDNDHSFANPEVFDGYCMRRAYDMADACARQANVVVT